MHSRRNWASLTTPAAAARCRFTGSEFVAPCRVAIIAAGTTANPLIQSTTPGLASHQARLHRRERRHAGDIEAGVFAGGDIVTGGATVILAMGAGRKAAKSINEF